MFFVYFFDSVSRAIIVSFTNVDCSTRIKEKVITPTGTRVREVHRRKEATGDKISWRYALVRQVCKRFREISWTRNRATAAGAMGTMKFEEWNTRKLHIQLGRLVGRSRLVYELSDALIPFVDGFRPIHLVTRTSSPKTSSGPSLIRRGGDRVLVKKLYDITRSVKTRYRSLYIATVLANRFISRTIVSLFSSRALRFASNTRK